MKSKFFTSEKIMDNVTMIAGLAGELCYLVEGKEKALLVDGLSGVGSLKAFVRELTDLPTELVLTHSHPDHMGAAFEYGKCYIHPDDISGLYEAGDAERRYAFAAAGAKEFTLRMGDAVPCVPVRTLPVGDGHVFDLGGTQLEVIAVPGHTWGHIVLLDRSARVVYSGDAVNCNTLLFLGGTSIEQYRESLTHLELRGGLRRLMGRSRGRQRAQAHRDGGHRALQGDHVGDGPEGAGGFHGPQRPLRPGEGRSLPPL